MAVRPAGARDLIRTIGMYYGDGDPWGTAMGWGFAICHVLWHCTAEPIPTEWGYRDGMGCDLTARDFAPGTEYHNVNGEGDIPHEEAELIALFPWLPYSYDETPEIVEPSHDLAERALLYVGEINHRYCRMLDLAGMSY